MYGKEEDLVCMHWGDGEELNYNSLAEEDLVCMHRDE